VNLSYKLAQHYIPGFVKRRELRNLFALTAAAFGRGMPSIAGMSHQKCLVEFARFTEAECKYLLIRKQETETVRTRLYRSAHDLGSRLRRQFDVKSLQEALDAGRLLYRILEIDFRATGDGQVTVKECFFSRYYSCETCRVMSAVDEGIISGLSNGYKLEFSQRITEGHECCEGRLTREEAPHA
jgi:hypothetical protein